MKVAQFTRGIPRFLAALVIFGFSSMHVQSEAYALEVQLSEAPTSDLQLTLGALRGASQSIVLNIYEFTSADIAQVLRDQILAGVRVQILQEGQLAGAPHLTAAAQGIQSELLKAMADSKANPDDRLFQMTSAAGGQRRFHFDHAKYAVIDGQTVLIGSENYSPSGNPVPGTLGNRGWEVYIHDPNLAQQFLTTFASDSSLSAKDVQELDAHASRQPRRPASNPSGRTSATPVPGFPIVAAASVVKLTSPDSSLSGIIALINSTHKTLDIEQMTFDSKWKGNATLRNPLMDAVVAAAHRGVRVRVLLNDESVFNHNGQASNPKNVPTATLLTQAGVEAQIANIKAMGVDYIHNKGLLADGNLTMISSVNWDQNSLQFNREAAVVINAPEVYAHYEALFEYDWKVSGGKP